MFYQFVWTDGNEEGLEKNIPLLWHGNHLKKMNWENPITLIFLKGLPLLSRNYIKQLTRLNYNIINGERLVEDLINKNYPQLKNYSDSSKFWFLRWNFLHHLKTNSIANEPIIHLDGDIVFTSDPMKLLSDVVGKTFVLQGCPAFTSISDNNWFYVWEQELASFLQNRNDYISMAMEAKRKPCRTNGEYCNETTYSPARFEDQEILQYVIAAGKIPQSGTDEIHNSNYYWMENPLLPGRWFASQKINGKPLIKEISGRPFVGHKPVAFYHFQSTFCAYCHIWLVLNKLKIHRILPANKIFNKNLGILTYLGRLFWRGIRKSLRMKKIDRKLLYNKVFRVSPKTGNYYITDIINSCW